MQTPSRIAIVGVGAVFSGAPTTERFWANILHHRDTSREVPAGRWSLSAEDAYHPAVAEPDRAYSLRGYFLDDVSLDFSGLEVDPEVLRQLDPVFHLVLHAGRQAWSDARTEALDRRRVGVIFGNLVLPTEKSSALSQEILGATAAELVTGRSVRLGARTHPLNARAAGLPASILARALGLSGGDCTLDAACASSLFALKLAADKLLDHHADAMIAGGVCRPDTLYTQMGFSQLRALSPSGRCRPLDAHGDGLVVGEGAGFFVLKRLEDAIDHGDRIYAVIAGIGLSNDIKGNLLAPDSEGQLRALRAAYAQAGWKPSDVDLIECHATGTPVGDAVELDSLHRLWAEEEHRPGQCVLGSVKANIGHTLTAAGAAGVLKLLMALQEKILPPTANFARPRANALSERSPFRILREPIPWQPRQASLPRRAAINGFGFGGTNAHVLLEEWLAAPTKTSVSARPSRETPIAIVGLDAHFGPWQGKQAFREKIFGRSPVDQIPMLSEDRWWGVEKSEWFRERGFAREDFRGWPVEKLAIPLQQFRIAPRDLEEMLPQQLLMLQVAARALADAGLGAFDPLRLGVFIGLTLDMNSTNFHFRWSMLPLARQWNRELELNLSERELAEWTDRLRQAAGPTLTPGRVLGALGSVTASRIAREFGAGGPSFTVSSEENSGLSALEIAVRLLRRTELDYALVGAVDFPGDVRAAIAEAQRKSASARQDGIGEGSAAVLLRRLDDAERDGNRIYAILRGELKSQSSSESDSAAVNLGSAAASIGASGAASGLATLVSSTLALYHRILPSRDGEREVQYWLHDRETGPRKAAIAQSGMDGNTQTLILEEPGSQGMVPSDDLLLDPPPLPPSKGGKGSPLAAHSPSERGEAIFAVEAEDSAALLRGLENLRSHARQNTEIPIDELARQWLQRHPLQPRLPLACALVPRDASELLSLIEAQTLRHGEAASADRAFRTPDDHVRGQLAFVFPGSGNHFPGMGRDLSAWRPDLFRRQEAENRRLRSQFAPEYFWNRASLDDVSDHRLLIQGQVALGTVVSDLLQSLGIVPDAALGYSLGETTALFALRIWQDRDEMLDRLFRSPLFSEELAGPCNAARKAWSLSPIAKVDWLAGVVAAGPEAVRQALRESKRAYLLLINTAAECVLGGERAEVEKIVARLGCAFFPLQGVSTVHCEIVREVEPAYRELHRLPVTPRTGLSLYSGASGNRYSPDPESCAEAITAQALSTVDFAGLIRQAYRDGVRIFLEIGPGASCTRMIGQILAGKSCFARSACVAGQSASTTILRLLAHLIAWRVPVDLRLLYGRTETLELSEAFLTASKNVLTIVPGRASLQMPTPPETSPPPPTKETVADRPLLAVAQDTRTRIIQGLVSTQEAGAAAHASFLRFADRARELLGSQFGLHRSLREEAPLSETPPASNGQEPLAFGRDSCMELAIGSVSRVFGPEFAEADSFPTRVRLPDEPLMLVDRILAIEGKPKSLTSGRIVTEHDVFPGDWYLDNDRMPAGISIESGQADLTLSGYLGIDFHTRGLAVYRLLDATVTFHRGLPTTGEIARYDIQIDHFFRQGDTHLFRFRFEGTVDGVPLLSMTGGCAGFFSAQELAGGKGIVRGENAPKPVLSATKPWDHLLPLQTESFDETQLDALRAGNLERCFGAPFARLKFDRPLTLPGGPGADERMRLLHRVTLRDPRGGAYGMGLIRAEQDIHPDDWFLTCHFVDDQVMPGTLMYECCLHALRVHLLSIGWIAEAEHAHFEPKPGVAARLKCRGQVIASTRLVTYEITIKKFGTEPCPYAVGNALMYADGKAIVEIADVSLQLAGVAYREIESLWQAPGLIASRAQILAFALGKPSEAFGAPYEPFDEDRRLARLPAPPYSFLDRVTSSTAEPWKMKAGGTAQTEYDIPADAWYFASNRQPAMPFAVLLEVALQPCGWLAAYVGSALTSPIDLRFRNLGGAAVQHALVTAQSGTLTTTVRLAKVVSSGGMIIQDFDYAVSDGRQVVFQGTTNFGFFTDPLMARQVGLRDANLYQPTENEWTLGDKFPFPAEAPFPDRQMRMIDRIDLYSPEDGPHGLGIIRGSFDVDPEAWFFKAHFFQDPVCPGSLGLEALLQLLKTFASRRFGIEPTTFETPILGKEFRWIYRGQIVPRNARVEVQAVITACDPGEQSLLADGWLSVDGLLIYQMNDFSLRII